MTARSRHSGRRTTPPPPLGASLDGPLATELRDLIDWWSMSQRRLVVLAADFADSEEWLIAGWPTAAHWLADAADIETSTAREWIRVGHLLRQLPATEEAFANGSISYAKVRALTRIATPENEEELLALAEAVPASHLNRSLASWVRKNTDDEELADHHHSRRSVRWRTEADGMIRFTACLTPAVAAILITALTHIANLNKKRAKSTTEGEKDASAGASATEGGSDENGGNGASAGERPTAAQQYADALEALLKSGGSEPSTEVVVHVRGDGCTLDDGTPIADSEVAHMVPGAFIRALIHDADGRPINASGHRRHPTTRQKRVVKERDRRCVDCGREDLLQYDHNPDYDVTSHTIVEELELRCAPCHAKRHKG